MGGRLEKLKLIFELATFGFAALFILTKLVGGQFNAGAELAVETTRGEKPASDTEDLVAVIIKLKRTDIGRIEVQDILIEATDLASGAKIDVPRQQTLIVERKQNRGEHPGVSEHPSENGVFLPPGDATQFAYLVRVNRAAPLLLDITVLASRSGPWIGHPQWRGSAISLPRSRNN